MYDRLNIHPGELLREEFLKPAGVSAERLAVDLGIPCERILDIIHARDGVCVDTAIRLSHYFGTSDRFWLDAQLSYDLRRASRAADRIRAEITPLGSAA